ncbi:hypothetical protein GCM10009733_081950 [Nonomuraea maheshkhaliensis]|uniref:Bacterial transcriptional activator domain-containing protein n=1 Tax=Nonomuraea maheshkhaliensis TaxID=419590 RepID=A0ABN2GJM4_9ACTN
MDIRVLGPVDVLEDGARIPVEGAQQRALELWRGQPLQGIGTPWVEHRVRVPLLKELWDLLEEHAATLIELSRHREVPPLLRGVRHDEPLRETPHALAMTALWHDGRTAEALHLFHDVRRLLADELGVDPGPRLRELHQRILEGHAPPAPPRRCSPPPSSCSR